MTGDWPGFSRRVHKESARVGGIWAFMLWPLSWPHVEYDHLNVDEECDLSARAHDAVCSALRKGGHLALPPGSPSREMIPAKSVAAVLKRSTSLHHRPGETCLHLGVWMITPQAWKGTRAPSGRQVVLNVPAPGWPPP